MIVAENKGKCTTVWQTPRIVSLLWYNEQRVKCLPEVVHFAVATRALVCLRVLLAERTKMRWINTDCYNVSTAGNDITWNDKCYYYGETFVIKRPIT